MSLHYGLVRAELLACLMGFVALTCAGTSALAQEQPRPERTPLAVCLQTNDPPLSVRSGDGPRGFAVALSRAIAERLDRDLWIQWFVSRDDPDANLAGMPTHCCQTIDASSWRNIPWSSACWRPPYHPPPGCLRSTAPSPTTGDDG
jgi:ABC-type amino acid transport substrate-binding protein